MKNKFLKRIIAIACVSTMLLASMTGCVAKKKVVKKGGSGEDVLKIMILAKGYGSDWLTALAEAFEKKHDVQVDISLVTSEEVIKGDIKNTEVCDTDLYFTIYTMGGHGLMAETERVYENGQALRDLTDVYNTEIPGEGITIADKMNASLREAYMVDGRDSEDTSDDTYYFMPYVSSAMGLYYNETVIDNALGKGKWSVPNTTDELIALCERLDKKGCSIMLPGSLDQWTSSVWMSWWAQYEGLENYQKFYQGIGYNKSADREEENSEKIFAQPGRLAATEVSHRLLNNANGYSLKNSVEITVNNLNEYQTRFTLAKNNYAIYPCGDWLMQELKNNSTIESDSVIKMMKTPVISSIVSSTDSYSADDAKRLPNITSDEILSQVVDYVDGTGELPAGVTEEEVAVVKEARNIVGGKFMEHFVYAPVFSDAKELADQFLLFMASDEGIQIFKDNCAGGFSPFKYEYKDLTTTEESVYEATKEAIYVTEFKHHELFFRGGVRAVTAGTSDTLDGMLCKPKGMTAAEINNAMIEAYSGQKWEGYLSKLSYLQSE